MAEETIVYNTPVQSLASDGLKQALVFLWPKLKVLGAYPVNLIHDEIVIECKEIWQKKSPRFLKMPWSMG